MVTVVAAGAADPSAAACFVNNVVSAVSGIAQLADRLSVQHLKKDEDGQRLRRARTRYAQLARRCEVASAPYIRAIGEGRASPTLAKCFRDWHEFFIATCASVTAAQTSGASMCEVLEKTANALDDSLATLSSEMNVALDANREAGQAAIGHGIHSPTNLPTDIEFFYDPHGLLRKLQDRLNEPSSNGRFSLAATGQGGVGKSAMAAKYCLDATKDRRRYQLVWWVLAEKRETCIQSLQGLFDFLSRCQKRGKLPGSIALAADLGAVLEHKAGTSEWIKLFKELLTEAEASWLLVFDNYSRHVSVDDLIPPGMSSPNQRHHVLLTTRDDDVDHPLDVRLWMEAGAENPYAISERFFSEIVFPRFKRDDCVVPDLLLPENHRAREQQVRDVCLRVDGLPLALALIARDLYRNWRKDRGYDLTSILHKWDELANATKVAMADGKTVKQDQTMDAILLMARDRLAELKGDDAEVKAEDVDAVFASVAYVAADNIPIDVLGCDEAAVAWLVEHALLAKKDGAYSVHRLTQDAMRRRQEASCNAKTANQAVLLLLGKAMQSDDEKLRQRVRVHAAIAMSRAQRASVEIPWEVNHVLQKLSLRAAIDDEDIELLQKIHEANPASMVQYDTEGLHAFHRAFNNRRLQVMLWLVSQVREFRDPSAIEPTTRCSLEKLELDDCGIEDGGLAKLAALLGALTNLATLSLYNNQLTSLPKELGALTNLTTLSLNNNQLTSLSKELGALTNLTTLWLHDNQLTSLPKELGALTNLTTLSLYNNQLTSLPKELGALTNLTTLSLNNNQLTSLPKELGALTNLTALSLYNNQLTSLPKELGALTNLATLWLSDNQLATLWISANQLTSNPKELGALTNLTTLSLRNNQLTSLPKELGALTNLTTLRLSNNQLTSIPKELGALTNLTTLSLRNNQLTSDDIPAPLQERAKSCALSVSL